MLSRVVRRPHVNTDCSVCRDGLSLSTFSSGGSSLRCVCGEVIFSSGDGGIYMLFLWRTRKTDDGRLE